MATQKMSLAESEAAQSRAKVLIVDDHQDSLISLTAIMEPLGVEVLTATSADGALLQLLKHDVAVVVLDVMMPEVDGFELAAMIRQRERLRHTPIIFLTGIGRDDEQMRRGYETGAIDFLLKPCDPEVLRFKVKILIELSRKNEALQRSADLVARKNAELELNSRRLQEALARAEKINADLQHEIAERHRAETSRDRLAGQLGATPGFVDAMAEGALALALDGSVLYCNQRLADILACSPVGVVGRSVLNFVAPSSREILSALLGTALEKSAKAEMDFVAADGETVPVQVALNSFRGDELQAIAVVVTDLRDQKRNEELVAEGRLARQILESALSGIAVCDLDGRVILASAELIRLCGSNPLFRHFDEIFPLQLTPGGAFRVGEVLAGRILQGHEASFRRADGRHFTLLLSAGPVAAGDDHAIGCVVTVADISERKQVEETLRRTEKLAAAGRIAGTLAHEVNNPLSAITNLLYLLETNDTLDDAGRQYLKLTTTEVERLAHIVRRTLAFYRDTSTPVEVNLGELIDGIIEIYSASMAEKHVDIARTYDFDGTLFAFPGELRQVFSNLICNAIEAVPDGGRVNIRVRRAREWAGGKRSGVQVVIGDNGCGIAREHYPKLFEPFFTTKEDKGTGLGLWVVQGIVQKHAGSVRIRSAVTGKHKGTAICVFLPMEPVVAYRDRTRDNPEQTVAAPAGCVAA